ncbi:MAG: MFS transporter [Natronomonas sp.]
MNVLSDPYRRRWIGYGFLVAAFFLVSFHRLTTAVLSEELMRTFDTTGASLGLLHSSFFILYAIFQVPSGVLADQQGARRIGAGGTVLMSLGAIVFGMAPTYTVAFLGRLIVGFGSSVLFVSTLRFCANWFEPSEFGTMTGLTFTIGIFGGLAASTPLALAISAIGWRPTMTGLGLVGLGLAAGIFLLSQNSPEVAGLPPIDEVPDMPSQSFADIRGHLTTAVKERETWLLGIVLFLLTGIGITIVGLWGIPFMVQLYDISVTDASVYILIGSAGGLIGPTLIGWISDRLERRTELIVLATAAFATTWGILAVLGTPPLIFIAVLLFISRVLRGGVPLAFTVIKERHHQGASGTVISLVNMMGWIGASIFPVLLGGILDAYWTGETVDGTRLYTVLGYRVAFGIAAVSGIVAVVCAVWLHVRHTRNHSSGAMTDASRESV